eukprot:8930291-Pyramimonas_sp.AAC.1
MLLPCTYPTTPGIASKALPRHPENLRRSENQILALSLFYAPCAVQTFAVLPDVPPGSAEQCRNRIPEGSATRADL